jgi:hypothetical protein
MVSQIASVIPQPTPIGSPVSALNSRCRAPGTLSPPVYTPRSEANVARSTPGTRSTWASTSMCVQISVGRWVRSAATYAVASNPSYNATVPPASSVVSAAMNPLTCTSGSKTCTMSSALTSPSASEVLVRMASAESWVCSTPFGTPVEPDVKKITAGAPAGADGGSRPDPRSSGASVA